MEHQSRYKLTEIETWAKICFNDSNIIQLYGVLREGKHFNILMEYVEGEDLESMIRRSKRLSVKQTVHYLKKICLQLKILHDQNIIHEDIKGNNLQFFYFFENFFNILS